jgi:hypothetical protein
MLGLFVICVIAIMSFDIPVWVYHAAQAVGFIIFTGGVVLWLVDKNEKLLVELMTKKVFSKVIFGNF